MPESKAPDTERIKKRILADYRNGKKPKELSEKYGISVNTIKSWVKRANAPPKASAEGAEKRVHAGAKTSRGGAPRDNTNSIGNSGGGAPLGNTNALIHGGYSPVYWDTLTDEEKELLKEGMPDGEQLLLDEITLLSLRERRIMKSIRNFTEGTGNPPVARGGQAVSRIIRTERKREFDSPEDQLLYEETIRQRVESGDRLPGREYQITTTTEATYDIVHRLEEALTRCQAQKQRCIDSLTQLQREKADTGVTSPAIAEDPLSASLKEMAEGLTSDDQ